jgi:hypothetical protein
VSKIDRSIYGIEVILRGEQSRVVGRRTGARISCERQLYAAALDASTFFADLGYGGEVNVQRQEKKEQQYRDADDASEFVRFGGQRRQHVKNLAQSIYGCQRAPELSGIGGQVPDGAITPALTAISSLVILLPVPVRTDRSRKFLKQRTISSQSSKPSPHRRV